ncbi:MAG: hemopexin repeat-containing protein [Ardenticatenaceae bacterium]
MYIDAVLDAGPDSTYFFKGNQYIRYNIRKNKADPGYPQPITKRWAGVTFDRIDAAIYWGGGKVYFFRNDQHIRYDMGSSGICSELVYLPCLLGRASKVSLWEEIPEEP